jgi:hypothetical protein
MTVAPTASNTGATPQSQECNAKECYSPVNQDAVSDQIEVRGRLDAYFPHQHLLVSERLRDFLLTLSHDVDFPCVSAKRRLYEVRPTRVLQVDIEKSEPLLFDFCIRCGNFECYLRGCGVFLYDIASPLKDGIYRTDLLAGCRMAKHFDVIVVPATKQKIGAANFRGLRFRPLPDLDPEFEVRKAAMIEAATQSRKKDRAYERLHRMRNRKGLVSPDRGAKRLFKT